MRRYAVSRIISLLVATLYNIVDQIFFANAAYTAFAPPRMEVTFDDGSAKVFPYPRPWSAFCALKAPRPCKGP